jgi:hypothetical protein
MATGLTGKARGKARRARPAPKPRRAAPARAKRKERELTVDQWISEQEFYIQDIVREVRNIIRSAAPEAKEVIRWGLPAYEVGKYVCYLRANLDELSLTFWGRADRLKDPRGLLTGGGPMRQIRMRSLIDIRPALFARWVRQTLDLPGRPPHVPKLVL